MEPNRDAMMVPAVLLLLPRNLTIMLSGIRYRVIETSISIIEKAGKITENFFQDILSALKVLLRSFKKEINTADNVNRYT